MHMKSYLLLVVLLVIALAVAAMAVYWGWKEIRGLLESEEIIIIPKNDKEQDNFYVPREPVEFNKDKG